MFIKQILLYNFKSHAQASFQFTERVVGICGQNAVGKTNLLDALYFACITKSHFTYPDAGCIRFGGDGFRLECTVDHTATSHKLAVIMRSNGKKEIAWDGAMYSKPSRHLGKMPAVLIAPDDIELINGSSEIRRRFLDGMLCQQDPEFINQFQVYAKVLSQRNALLKTYPGQAHELLNVYDAQLAKAATYIAAKRLLIAQEILPQALANLQRISNYTEYVQFEYQAALQVPTDEGYEHQYLELLKLNRQKDLLTGRTNFGIHREELVFKLGEGFVRHIASQGQKKTVLLALKLTEYEWLQQNTGICPALFLDDIFEKLDEQRIASLLKQVCIEKQGQVFITDTHAERLTNQLRALAVNHQIVQL